MKHVNQPVRNAPQNMRLTITKKTLLFEKEDLIIKKDMEQDDIKHLKENCNIDYEDDIQEITAPRTPMKKIGRWVCDMLSKIYNEKWVEKTNQGIAH